MAASASISKVPLVLCIIACMFSLALADASRPLGDFTAGLKHEKIPDDSSKLNGDFLQSYLMSLIPIVAPGFAFAILSIVIGVIYGIIRLCCCLCCSSDDEDDEKKKTFPFKKRAIPTAVYVVAFCWILAGCIIGWTSNAKFSSGAVTLSSTVRLTGVQAGDLVDTMINNLTDVVASVPVSLVGIKDQVSGLPQLASDVGQLGQDVNSTKDMISGINAQVKDIQAYAGVPLLADLDQTLEELTVSSNDVINNVGELTREIATELNQTLATVLNDLDTQIADVKKTSDDIAAQARDFANQAKDAIKNADQYLDMFNEYDGQRNKGLAAVYAVGLVSCAIAGLGYLIAKGFPFHITAGFGFVFSFLFWASGSVHLLLGIVLSDVCPVVDAVVKSALPSEGTAAAAINGCLGDTSLFDSLGVRDQFNLSEIYEYKNEFGDFTNFVDEFNFTSIDSYLGDVNELYTFNLTAQANNITAETFGWNQTIVYEALDALNALTNPDTFTLDDYTTLNLNDYTAPNPRNQINETYHVLDGLVMANRTIYERIDGTKQRMYATQHSMDLLLGNITTYQEGYDGIKTDINTLQTTNITNALGIIQGMIDKVEAFFTLGDCSFLGRNYRSIISSICDVMSPAIDLLMASQFMVALGLIPTIVLAEILAIRIPSPGDDDKEEYDYNDNRGDNSVSLNVRSEATA